MPFCNATMASASTSTTNPVADVRPEAAGEEVSLKRKKNEAEWKKNVAKARKNSGKEYISRSTGKVMAARRVRDPCGCPKSCFDKLGEEAVRSIFTEYWNIGEFNAQSAYLLTRVKSKEVKKRRVAAEGSRRSATLEYTVHVGERNVVVCKKAFLNIHDIGDRRVLNVLKKTGDTGVAPVDRRGSHGHTHNKPAEDVKQLGHDHIKSLPLCSSHYSRAKSRHRLYLPPGYTQQHCYSLFQLWCEGKDVPADKVMNFDAYRRMFTTYNIGQSPPKVDTCSTCDKLVIELEAATEEKDEAKKRCDR